jgi:putative N6-adenine-specific DNA methylase
MLGAMAGDLDCLVVCPPGTEAITAAELEALGIRRTKLLRGGVEMRARQRQLYAANRWLRTATRILVRVASFRATTTGTLERHAREVPWAQWIPPGGGVVVRATCHRSRLHHTEAVAERIAAATGATLVPAAAPQPGGVAAPLVVARIDRDRCTLSVDSSGGPLHHRTWRRPAGRAPLRPTLAAAALAACGWPPAAGTGPPDANPALLVDPFCGSGTLAVEAALWAGGQPPDPGRHYAFQHWADFAAGTWASVTGSGPPSPQAAAGGPTPPRGAFDAVGGTGVRVYASDRDAGVVAAARDNARRAGMGSAVEVTQAPVSDLLAPVPPVGAAPAPGSPAGWVVTNPPWGGRLGGGGDLRNLYARLGEVLTRQFEGWVVGLVVADRRLANHTGLPLHEVLRTTSGGQPVVVVSTRKSDGGNPARPDGDAG